MLKGVPTTHRSRKLRSATKEGNTSRGAPNWAAWARETGGHSWGTAEVAVRRISSLSPCPSISCNQRQVWGFVIHRTLGTIQKRRHFFFFNGHGELKIYWSVKFRRGLQWQSEGISAPKTALGPWCRGPSMLKPALLYSWLHTQNMRCF